MNTRQEMHSRLLESNKSYNLPERVEFLLDERRMVILRNGVYPQVYWWVEHRQRSFWSNSLDAHCWNCSLGKPALTEWSILCTHMMNIVIRCAKIHDNSCGRLHTCVDASTLSCRNEWKFITINPLTREEQDGIFELSPLLREDWFYPEVPREWLCHIHKRT